MRNRTDSTRISPLDRLRGLFAANRVLFELAGAAAGGFVLANSFIFGGVSPFGVAFSASLPGKHSQCAALGAVLGYVVSSSLLGNMKYIVALVLVAAIKWFLESKLDKPCTPVWNVLTACVGMTIASAVVIFTADYTVYELLLAVAEISLASGSAYFLSRTLTVLDAGLAGATRADLSCAVVSVAVVLMGFSGFRLGSLSMGRILAVILILLCARYGGEAAGAVAGITAGIAIGLTGRDYGYVASAYALGGLVAGIFSHGGRLAAAGVFIVINALTALFISGNVDVYTAVLEIFAASVLFMLIPGRWVKKWKITAMRAGPDGSPQSLLRGRLAGLSRALREIGATTRQVSEKLGKLEGAGLGDMQVRVADKVCRHCGSRTTCWQFHYDETTAAMKDCLHRMKKDGSLSREDVPRHLSRTCCKLDILLTEMNTAFRDSVAREGVQRKVSQVRSVVTDQFDGIAIMLDEISGEVCAIRQVEPPKQARIREYLHKKHFQSDRILCYTDEFDRMKLEITIPTYQLPKVDKAGAALDLSALLEADFDLPQVNVLEKETTLIFHEKAAFTTELGAFQIASDGHKLCGDAYNYIREQAGRAHLILSDGMGSGGAAAVDSSMASGLITRMLSVGIGHEAALKMVNSALLIKSGEESLATIDICTMDLFTGQAEFYKAGAAPSYILRAGRAGYVESTSLPAGILRGVAFEKSAVTLRAGDTVVLVSDGVVATGTEWVVSELELLSAIGDNQRLCEKLAMTAKLRREDGREDDITVLAATLLKGV